MRRVEALYRDLHFGLRGLRKNPGFAATAIVMLALGIGANTAIFTVVRAVLLKPLSYPDPGRLVRLSGGITLAHFELIRAAHAFIDIGAFAAGIENLSLSGADRPEMLKGARVTSNFLRILGVEPALGRGFVPEEDARGGPAVALISTELWIRRFHADKDIMGRAVTLAAAPYTIVGILPPRFAFPFQGVDVWIPRPTEWSVITIRLSPLSPVLEAFARLKPGTTLQDAAAEINVLNHQYAAAHPGMLDARPNRMAGVRLLKDDLVAEVRAKLWMLFGAVGFVLLIACANVASLLLARAAGRSREFAVRTAIGAGRGRLIGQLLAESCLLAFLGGGLGVLLAGWLVSGMRRMSFLDLPRLGEIRPDWTVLAFAAAVSIVTGILFGLAPSLGAARPDLVNLLRGGELVHAGPSTAIRRWFTTRSLLVLGQVALSIVLLIAATLLMQSIARLHSIDTGFERSGLLTLRLALPPARYDSDRKAAAFFNELIRRIEALPGVKSAAATRTLPTTGWAGAPVQVAERAPVKLNERPIAILQSITLDYFETLKVGFERGRKFTAHDNAEAPAAVIINEALARHFWPEYPNGQSPIGQHVFIGANNKPVQIIGIAADVRQSGLDDDPMPGVYLPYAQSPQQSAMLAVRAQGDPLRIASAVRREVWKIDRDQGFSDVKTMDDVLADSEGQRQAAMTLLALFAAVATLLTAVGLYGLIAYSTVQRARELGIRRALGARSSDLLFLVATQGVGLTLAGIVLGIAGALALTRVLGNLLFRVSPTDPITFAAVPLLFIVITLAAGFLPAMRAARIDPLSALRAE